MTTSQEARRCSDGGECGAGGYCEACPARASQEAREYPPLPEPRAWQYWHRVDSLKKATISKRMDSTLKGAEEYAEFPLYTAEQVYACIDSDRKARQQEALQWRDMKTDPPSKTGRYVVCHSGGIGGDAFYTAKAGDTHYKVGWSQVPSFQPTHWIDAAIAKGER